MELINNKNKLIITSHINLNGVIEDVFCCSGKVGFMRISFKKETSPNFLESITIGNNKLRYSDISTPEHFSPSGNKSIVYDYLLNVKFKSNDKFILKPLYNSDAIENIHLFLLQ